MAEFKPSSLLKDREMKKKLEKILGECFNDEGIADIASKKLVSSLFFKTGPLFALFHAHTYLVNKGLDSFLGGVIPELADRVSKGKSSLSEETAKIISASIIHFVYNSNFTLMSDMPGIAADTFVNMIKNKKITEESFFDSYDKSFNKKEKEKLFKIYLNASAFLLYCERESIGDTDTTCKLLKLLAKLYLWEASVYSMMEKDIPLIFESDNNANSFILNQYENIKSIAIREESDYPKFKEFWCMFENAFDVYKKK